MCLERLRSFRAKIWFGFIFSWNWRARSHRNTRTFPPSERRVGGQLSFLLVGCDKRPGISQLQRKVNDYQDAEFDSMIHAEWTPFNIRDFIMSRKTGSGQCKRQQRMQSTVQWVRGLDFGFVLNWHRGWSNLARGRSSRVRPAQAVVMNGKGFWKAAVLMLRAMVLRLNMPFQEVRPPMPFANRHYIPGIPQGSERFPWAYPEEDVIGV